MSEASGVATENTVNGHHNGTPEEDIPQEYKGWLMKRTKISHKWKKQFFLLRKTTLFYSDSEESKPKQIPLDGAEIAESDIDNKPNAFHIRPNHSKRLYYLHAEDEESQQEWMQAVCFAKAAGQHGDASQACTIQ